MRGVKRKMSGKLEDLFLDYIRWEAILNHLDKYDGTFEEMSVVLGELETLKIKIKRELDT